MKTKDEIWEEIKSGPNIYGEPMLNAFVKTTNTLERRHYDSLPEALKNMVSPVLRLNIATTPEEAQRAMKDGADDPPLAFAHAIMRDDKKMAEWFLDNATINPSFAINTAASSGKLWSVQMLHERGNTNFDDALWWACREHKSKDMVVFLVSKGAKDTGGKGLYAAAKSARDPIAREIAMFLVKSKVSDVDKAFIHLAGEGAYEGTRLLAHELENPKTVMLHVIVDTDYASAIFTQLLDAKKIQDSWADELLNAAFRAGDYGTAKTIMAEMRPAKLGDTIFTVSRYIDKHGSFDEKPYLRILTLLVGFCKDRGDLEDTFEMLETSPHSSSREASEIVGERLKEMYRTSDI
jgi:hypothetical protein